LVSRRITLHAAIRGQFVWLTMQIKGCG